MIEVAGLTKRHRGRTAYAHLLALARGGGLPASRADDVVDLVGLEAVAHERVRGLSLGTGSGWASPRRCSAIPTCCARPASRWPRRCW